MHFYGLLCILIYLYLFLRTIYYSFYHMFINLILTFLLYVKQTTYSLPILKVITLFYYTVLLHCFITYYILVLF